MARAWRAAALPQMQRIVIGVDPAAKASAGGDRTSETGIVVAGLGEPQTEGTMSAEEGRRAGWLRKNYLSQFSNFKPSTRANSRSFALTSVQPSAMAWAAISISFR